MMSGLDDNGQLERAKGFEPSTPTLARLCSTPELHPLTVPGLIELGAGEGIRTLDPNLGKVVLYP
ncbi:hypothetical protein Maq22A_c19370 [Methylobacterium aquaticum]|uniref:Uncharacterized protein n=1 Tax=Methylobacterium aquaticum TaxID=270351 RepID=A0A0C6FNT6_9HYPH|nr:hypothetical protein Maq22A_c19370 [Methylobacterium aquaticum]